MDVTNNGKNKDQLNHKLLDYIHELVMLNFIFEREIITIDEMGKIRQEIMKKYGIKSERL